MEFYGKYYLLRRIPPKLLLLLLWSTTKQQQQQLLWKHPVQHLLDLDQVDFLHLLPNLHLVWAPVRHLQFGLEPEHELELSSIFYLTCNLCSLKQSSVCDKKGCFYLCF